MDLTDLNALKQGPSNNFIDFGGGAKGGNVNANILQNPPQIPERPNQHTGLAQPNVGAYGLGYTGGYSSQQGYGASSLYSNPYASNNYFSNYSTPYSAPYGSNTNNSSNSFLRAADESSRTAFQSIESIVHAFSAVSAMFESTYLAVYNSFRAVVGVADQFYRLKTHLTSIFSIFAIARFFKLIYRKIMRIFRLSTNNGEWLEAKQLLLGGDASEKFIKNGRKQTNWPLIMFFAVVVGGPWLIWKILSSIESLNKDDNLWMSGKIDHFIAVSEYDFDAVNVDELSFRRGQRIVIAPKEYQPKLRGWLLGTVDGKTQGILPANYLKILGKKIGENSAKRENPDVKISSDEEKRSNNVNMEKIFDEIV